MKWRLIELNSYPAAMNMAIDEAILEAVSNNESNPTIRFYKWENGGISLGRAQSYSIIDESFCRDYNLQIVRRPTGGNAVYHHPEDFTYSVVVPASLFHQSSRELYKTVLSWIINSLPEGLEAKLHGKNDIVIDGKKICGNAQLKRQAGKRAYFLQHGSIFYYPSQEIWKGAFNLDSSLVNNLLSIKTFSDISPTQLYENLKRSFTEKISFSTGELTTKEVSRANVLVGERYSNDEWTKKEGIQDGTICAIDIKDD